MTISNYCNKWIPFKLYFFSIIAVQSLHIQWLRDVILILIKSLFFISDSANLLTILYWRSLLFYHKKKLIWKNDRRKIKGFILQKRSIFTFAEHLTTFFKFNTNKAQSCLWLQFSVFLEKIRQSYLLLEMK